MNRSEKYDSHFEGLKYELKEREDFAHVRDDFDRRKSQNRVYFWFDAKDIQYEARFVERGERKGQIRAAVKIEKKSQEETKELFDVLAQREEEIESEFAGGSLIWEREDYKKRSRISVYREGNIDDLFERPSELPEIKRWHIESLVQLRRVFEPE